MNHARPRAATTAERPARPSAAVAVALLAGLAAAVAQSAGTPAGSVIDNTALVRFDLGGASPPQSSNTVSLTIDERLDVSVTALATQVRVAPGATGQVLAYTLTNTGNGVETFALASDSGIGGDDFDPTPTSPAIWFDADGSGDLGAADVAYAPGVNDPQLAADASLTVLLVHDIPPGFGNGSLGVVSLTATAATGSGAPGSSFAGQGDGGGDAVVGGTGGSATATAAYLVSDVQVSVQKSVVVLDPFGGSEPVPGATLTYTVTVAVVGSGTAANSVFSDAIPANTSYVPGSILLDAAALTDAADGDAGELDIAGTPAVVVRLGDLTQADGTLTISFQVTID